VADLISCTSLWIVAVVAIAAAAAGTLTVLALLALGVIVGKRHLSRKRRDDG
jgi:hypothetical protein